ncbi:MAG: YdiL family protein [Burkholderiales bacterium]|jgi:hypothetical protein|nr:YdiL family protein [Burkholderiales bacterium]
MDGNRLKMTRQSLHFPIEEIAPIVGEVDVMTWHGWESGSQPVPKYVEQRLFEMTEWRRETIKTYVISFKEGESKGYEIFPILWYDNFEDFSREEGIPGTYFHVWQSVIAEVMMVFPEKLALVPFDREDYLKFLNGRTPTAETRNEWFHRAADHVLP